MLTSRLAAAPAAALLALALAACGGSSTDAEAEAPTSPSASVEETPEADGLDLTVENFAQVTTDAMTAAGSYDFLMEMDAAGEAMTMSGSADLSGDTQSIAVKTDMAGLTMEVRAHEGMAYVNLGEITGGKFIAIDPTDASNPLADSFSDLAGEVDPTQDILAYEEAMVSVTPTGEPEQLDGVEVQAYDVVIDPTKAPELAADLESSLPLGVEMPETITYTYWLDADALTHRIRFAFLEVSADMRFSSWGSATPVTAPAPEEITTESPFGG